MSEIGASCIMVVQHLSKEADMTLRIGSIVWGVRDVPRAIQFWCKALRYKPLRKPSNDWAILVPNEGDGQQMAITIVSSDPETHQRHHLDLYASNREAEVERLLGLGATRVEWRYPDGADYVVLADPDGNKFCVIRK
jgi:catechol 2,3-dioxygenase-like lactoylglutathione lyase family enzyme